MHWRIITLRSIFFKVEFRRREAISGFGNTIMTPLLYQPDVIRNERQAIVHETDPAFQGLIFWNDNVETVIGGFPIFPANKNIILHCFCRAFTSVCRAIFPLVTRARCLNVLPSLDERFENDSRGFPSGSCLRKNRLDRSRRWF